MSIRRMLVALLTLQQVFFAVPARAAMNLQAGKAIDAGGVGAVGRTAPVEARVGANSFTGEATVRIPIFTPPGTGGHTPQVALAYGSHRSNRNSPVGAGWELAIGPSMVQRSTRDGAPNYDTSDTFQLAGVDLVETATAGRYITENFDHSRIEHITGGGEDYWLVLRPDGTRLYYGYEYDSLAPNLSRVDSILVSAVWHTQTSCPTPFLGCSGAGEDIIQPSIPFGWYLDRVEDRNGNVIHYRWDSLGDQGERYLVEISYSGHVGGAIAAVPDFGGSDDATLTTARSIQFTYGLIRGEILPTYRRGFPRVMAHRLTAINVTVDASSVRQYVLEYVDSPRSGRALLDAVRERGSDGDANSEFVHSFAYGSGGGSGWSALDSTWDLPGTLSLVNDRGIRVFDANGDGWVDIVQAGGSSLRNTYLGGPGGFSLTSSEPWELPANIEVSNGTEGVTTGDFDGDGRQDLIRRRLKVSGFNEIDDPACGSSQKSRHHDVATAWTHDLWRNDGATWVVDAANDFDSFAFQTQSDNPSFDSCPVEYLPARTRIDGLSARFDQATRVADVNGDGRDDLLYNRAVTGLHTTGSDLWVTDDVRVGALLNGPNGLANATPNHFFDSILDRTPQGGSTVQEAEFLHLFQEPRWQVPPSLSIAWSNFNSCWSTGNVLGEAYSGSERIVDINGDGLPEILESGRFLPIPYVAWEEHTEVWINNGYTWKDKGAGVPTTWEQFVNPAYLYYSIIGGEFSSTGSACVETVVGDGLAFGFRLIDLNGDGRTDGLGDGGGGTDSVLWSPTTPAKWVLATAWNSPVALAGDDDGSDPGVRIADVNADGMPDILVSTGAYLNQAEPPDKLETVASPWGAVTTLSYVPHTQFDASPPVSNPSIDGQRRQPHPIWVVDSLEVDAGSVYSQPVSIREFEYYDGVYDEGDRNFRGFQEAIELGPVVAGERSLQRSYFWTDDALRGQPAEVQLARVPASDPTNETPLRVVRHTYAESTGTGTSTIVNPDGTTVPLSGQDLTELEGFVPFRALVSGAPDADQATLAFTIATENEAVEGNQPASRLSKTERSYDQYGNLRIRRELGDTADADDDVTVTTTYAVLDDDGGTGVLPSLLANTRATEIMSGLAGSLPAGTVLQREMQIYYDGSSTLGTVARGNPTAVERRWKASAWARVDRSYDVYGNITLKTSSYEKNGTDLVSQTDLVYDTASRTFATSLSVGGVGFPNLTLAASFEYEDYNAGAGCGGPPGMGLVCRAVDANGGEGLATYDRFGRLTHASGPNGAERTVDYHDADRGTVNQRIEERLRWDPNGPTGSAIETDPNAIQRITFYDGLLRTLETRRSGQGAAILNSQLTYDAAGRMATSTRWNGGGGAGQSTDYSYDVVGRMVRVDRPDTAFSTVSYEPWQMTLQDHDESGALKRERVERTDGFARLTAVDEYEDPTGSAATTTYLYDPFGQLAQVDDAVANDLTLCESTTCETQRHSTVILYDELGSRVSLDDPDSGLWIDEPNARGLVVKQTDPRLVEHELEYDALGRLIRREALTDVDGRADLRILQTYTYGDLNTTVPNGIGRIVRMDDDRGSADFEYDAAGNITRHVRVLEGLEFEFVHSYDPLDRRLQTSYPDGEIVTWHYDKRLLERISTQAGPYTDDIVASITYDALDRPNNLEVGGSAGSPVLNQTWAYETVSGRLDSITGVAGGLTVADIDLTVNGVGQVVGFDTALIAPQETTPISRMVTYGYDGLDRVISADGNLGVNPAVSKNFSYSYDGVGNMTTKDFVAGTQGFALQYLDPDRPHAATQALAPLVYPLRTFEYDDAGNVTRKTFQQGSGSAVTEELYTYDSLGQLVEVQPQSGANLSELDYDGFGRRVFKKRSTGTLLYPEPGYIYHQQLKRVNKHFFVDGRRVASLSRGWTAPAAAESPLVWQLPRVPAPPAWAAPLAYGAFLLLFLGVAVQRRPSLYARRTRVLSVLILAGVAPALLAGRPRPSNPPHGMHSQNAVFYVTDHLGSTIVAVAPDGSVRNQNVFEPYGDSVIESGTALQYLFAGGERAIGTSVYALGSRGYDPETGRFLSPDLLVPDPANPQSYNRYAYALHNPLVLLDPTGLFPEGSGTSSPSNESTGSSEGGGFHIDIVIYVPGPSGPGAGGPSPPPPPVSEATSVPTPNQVLDSPTANTATEPPGGVSAATTDERTAAEEVDQDSIERPFFDPTDAFGGAVAGAIVGGPGGAIAGGIIGGLVRGSLRGVARGVVRKGGRELLETTRDRLLREARDPRLRDTVDQLYRPGAKIGSGSSMDALRHERATGVLTSPAGKTQKLLERRTQLMRLRGDPKLNDSDRRIVRELLTDIQGALSGN